MARIFNKKLFLISFIILFSFGFSTTTKADITTGLLGHWGFEEGSGGTTADSSGNGNTGTLTNPPAWVAGQVGSGALNFDGDNDVVNMGKGSGNALNDIAQFSVSAWIYPETTGENANAYIMAKTSGESATGWTLHLAGTRIVFEADFDGAANLFRNSVLNTVDLNTWAHYIVTWDGTTNASNVHIYKNGVEVSYTTTTNGVGNRVSDSTMDFLVGNGRFGSRTFDGTIDDVRIYNRVLSGGDIAELSGSDATPPTVDSFAIPSTYASLTVPISSFAASDNVGGDGVTGYMATTSSSAPTANDPTWLGSAPTTYTFTSEGSKTLYAWAKDAAGNVSTSLSDTVDITLTHISYIRAEATGNDDGTSWENAFPTFADVTWTRGDTYYVAGGTYTEDVTIAAAESGTDEIIIKKANTSDNSGDVGWNASYASTQTVINGFLTISNSYVTIDGVTGSGTSGHGIKILKKDGIGAGNAIINFASGKSFLDLSHIELEGPGMGYATGASGFKQNTSSGTSKGLHLSYLYFHDLSQNGFVFVNTAGTSFVDYGLLFENNVLSDNGYNLAAAHGQGIQCGSGAGATTQSYWIVRNSIIHNNVGTGDIACLGFSSNDHMDIYNNIFYNDNQSFDAGSWIDYETLKDASSPGVIYFSDTDQSADRVRIYNNTFYNISRNTIYFGDTSTNNEVVNNLFMRGHFNIVHVGVTGSYNDYYDNEPIISSGSFGVPYGEVGQQGESSSPVVDAAGGDFNLVAGANAIGNGTDLSAVFTTDFAGNTRTSWDIGAYEYVAESTYTIAGTVSGLSGTVVLQNNAADDESISSSGAFVFDTALTDGASYSVTVSSQPSGQTCTVTNGSGTVASANVTSVVVTCTTNSTPAPSSGSSSSGGRRRSWPISLIQDLIQPPQQNELQINTPTTYPPVQVQITPFDQTEITAEPAKSPEPQSSIRSLGTILKNFTLLLFSSEDKEKLPTEIVFAKPANLPSFDVSKQVSLQTEEKQPDIHVLQGKSIDLAVKPDKPVKEVTGYLTIKKIDRLTALNDLDNQEKRSQLAAAGATVENKLVLEIFKYTDTDEDGIYTATITAPRVTGQYDIMTIMEYEDKKLGYRELHMTAVIDPEGYIYTMSGGLEARVPNTKVTLLVKTDTGKFITWPASDFKQTNPQTTDKTGNYSFLVPEGVYKLTVTASDYYDYNGTEFAVTQGAGVHENIELVKRGWLKTLWRWFSDLF